MSPRVLIIDDEPTLCQTLGRVLVTLGYEVATATDAETAYALLHERRFDVILLDMRIGATMGDALYFAITRQWPELLGRIVLMSGAAAPPSGEWPAELAQCPYLLKPFSLDLLARTIASVLPSQVRQQHDSA